MMDDFHTSPAEFYQQQRIVHGRMKALHTELLTAPADNTEDEDEDEDEAWDKILAGFAYVVGAAMALVLITWIWVYIAVSGAWEAQPAPHVQAPAHVLKGKK